MGRDRERDREIKRRDPRVGFRKDELDPSRGTISGAHRKSLPWRWFTVEQQLAVGSPGASIAGHEAGAFLLRPSERHR